MTGFFEYHHQGSKKYPFFIRDRNSDILLVAGLWDSAIIDGQEWKTFTIVTVPANETMAAIQQQSKKSASHATHLATRASGRVD